MTGSVSSSTTPTPTTVVVKQEPVKKDTTTQEIIKQDMIKQDLALINLTATPSTIMAPGAEQLNGGFATSANGFLFDKSTTTINGASSSAASDKAVTAGKAIVTSNTAAISKPAEATAVTQSLQTAIKTLQAVISDPTVDDATKDECKALLAQANKALKDINISKSKEEKDIETTKKKAETTIDNLAEAGGEPGKLSNSDKLKISTQIIDYNSLSHNSIKDTGRSTEKVLETAYKLLNNDTKGVFKDKSGAITA